MSEMLDIKNLDIDRLHKVLSMIPENQFLTPRMKPGTGKSTAILSLMMGEVEFGSGQVYGVFAAHPMSINDLKTRFKVSIKKNPKLDFIEYNNKIQLKGQTWIFLSFGCHIEQFSFDGIFADITTPYANAGQEDRRYIDKVLRQVKCQN